LGARKVDVKLPGKGNSNSRGARPVYKNHFDDSVDSDQEVDNKDLSLSAGAVPVQAAVPAFRGAAGCGSQGERPESGPGRRSQRLP